MLQRTGQLVLLHAVGIHSVVLLNGLNPIDPVSFLVAVATLGLVIALATYLPARRALGSTPAAALRRD